MNERAFNKSDINPSTPKQYFRSLLASFNSPSFMVLIGLLLLNFFQLLSLFMLIIVDILIIIIIIYFNWNLNLSAKAKALGIENFKIKDILALPLNQLR